jgi:thioredoxin 1
MGAVNEISGNQFESQVLKAQGPVLVDFYATWCGPCQMLAPVLDNLAGKYAGKVKIVKVNVDRDMDIASRCGIHGVPTQILFKGGKAVDTLVGYRPESEIARHLEAAAG